MEPSCHGNQIASIVPQGVLLLTAPCRKLINPQTSFLEQWVGQAEENPQLSHVPIPGTSGIYWLHNGREQVLPAPGHSVIQEVVFHRTLAGCGALEECSSIHNLSDTLCLHSHGNGIAEMIMWWHFNPGVYRATQRQHNCVITLEVPRHHRTHCSSLYKLSISWFLVVQRQSILSSWGPCPDTVTWYSADGVTLG